MLNKIKTLWWIDLVFLALISALTYLPDVLSFGYYRDDWYYMYDGLIGGPKIFETMFLHLRPARGPLFAFLFSLFGNSPLPYHLVLYLWRFLGGLAMFWLFDLLWPKQRKARFFAALMFTIYPGFLWWVAGVEYQPMVFSLGLHVFSIALTLMAIQTETLLKKTIWYALSLLTGWYALSLVDYSIGLEAFRLMGIFMFVQRKSAASTWWQKIVTTLKLAAPVLLIPIAYLLWRQIFFENWRRATDFGVQLSAILSSTTAIFWWFIYLIQSMLNVAVFAWGVPFGELFYANRLRDILVGLAFAGASLVIVFLADKLFSPQSDDKENSSEYWQREAILLGILGTLVGVLPIVLGNRTVSFGRFSHYALPASMASVLLLTGLVFSLKDKIARIIVISLVVTLAVLTHRGLSAQARTENTIIKNFWWQMSWRAPDLRPDTLLLVDYPFDFSDDVDVVYGPANFIYYPEKQSTPPVKLIINAEAISGSTVTDILLGKRELTGNYYGAHEYHINYENILIITQPSANACLRVMDPRWTNFSRNDRDWILGGASKSGIGNIALSGSPHRPPDYLFGPEPEHGWCYYFQKADLARQAGDWETVAQLYDEAKQQGLTPNDQIELMPFLQAYAYLGDQPKVKQIASIVNSEAWYRLQACQVLRGMAAHDYALQPDMQAFVEKLFCVGED